MKNFWRKIFSKRETQKLLDIDEDIWIPIRVCGNCEHWKERRCENGFKVPKGRYLGNDNCGQWEPPYTPIKRVYKNFMYGKSDKNILAT